MSKRYTLKIYPQGNGREVYRVLEISGTETLDKLCEEILNTFDFIDEHLYEFCMDCRMYSDDTYRSDPEDDERSTRINLNQLQLREKQKFALHYDFGDDWMFMISVQKMRDEKEYRKPEVVKSKGCIEQYPVWDEDDFEWED